MTISLTILFLTISHGIGIATSLHAILNARSAQGSVAWCFFLIGMPYFAVPVYWVFGRNRFQGYVYAHHDGLAELKEVLDYAQLNLIENTGSTGMSAEVIRGTQHLARLPATGGNSVKLLIDGEATFESIFTGIDAAQHYILLQFYIVRDDALGQKISARLIEKANAGVLVYFLYDEIGSIGLSSSFLGALRAAGIKVSTFNTTKGLRNHFQINFRNHRKIVVVDGLVAWVGGNNIGDEYLGRDKSVGRWRDTHIRIEGPATIPIQLSFVEDWHWATDTALNDLAWNPVEMPDAKAGVLVIPSGPADKHKTASLAFVQAIHFAQKRLWITSPFFVPSESIILALQSAGLRGVDVRIMIPDKSSHRLISLAAYYYIEELQKSGVEFYRYEDGFLHQKVLLVDDSFAFVGTMNLDNRSLHLNFEITTVILDDDFVQQVERMLLRDFRYCAQMEHGTYAGKNLWFKLAVSTVKLAAPVL